MKPNKSLITIRDNKERIKGLLMDLVLMPRIKALEWSKITKQTPNMKIGYPGQHLASLVAGMEGAKTGARGHDIVDGSEVKSCSRVDQVDSCKDCGEKILRIEKICSNCGSTNIMRMNDSKWLFTIRNENDLKVLTNDVGRIILTIADYPEFEKNNFEDLRFQVFEIWTKSPRSSNFVTLMTNYYQKIVTIQLSKSSYFFIEKKCITLQYGTKHRYIGTTKSTKKISRGVVCCQVRNSLIESRKFGIKEAIRSK